MIRILLFLVLLAPASAFAQNGPAPVVVELFTSQGCAYCPPADALLGKLAQSPGVVALSCHVDYFPVEKQNLGRGFCSRRQAEYRQTVAKGPRYTPQMIINGRTAMIGSEAGKVSAAMLKARGQGVLPLTISRAPRDGFYYFSLPTISGLSLYTRLWMIVYDTPHRMVMTEGNNFGKTITYHNVVSRMDDLGSWDGVSGTRTVNANFAPKNGGIVILVQDMASGHIIAAGQAAR